MLVSGRERVYSKYLNHPIHQSNNIILVVFIYRHTGSHTNITTHTKKRTFLNTHSLYERRGTCMLSSRASLTLSA
jgi:hypothetical protein